MARLSLAPEFASDQTSVRFLRFSKIPPLHIKGHLPNGRLYRTIHIYIYMETKHNLSNEAVTPAQYRAFQQAYDFFNEELFRNTLPQVMVTLQRKAKAKGYFSPDRFVGRIDKSAAHELAMNPDCFTGRDDEGILSTLAHEMVHVWQQSECRPPSRPGEDSGRPRLRA